MMGAQSYVAAGYLWPSFVSTALIAALAWYGWRRRKTPGALPFVAACLFALAWSIGSLLQAAAVEPDAKVFWLRFVTVWQLPLVTAATCFVLQYAGLGRWLTRRALVVLLTPPLVYAALILTSSLHGLAWSELSVVDGIVQARLGAGLSVLLAYSYALSLFNGGVLLWLFVRSPRHRAPVALMLLAQILARVLFAYGVLGLGFPREWDPDPIVLGILFGFYAVALFRFHGFDPLPLARTAVVEQMHEGIVVTDDRGRIVDANPSAERALGERVGALRGRPARDVVPLDALDGDGGHEAAFDLGSGAEARRYRLRETQLEDRHGQRLGHLLLLQDVTEQERAREMLLEQERVVATLRERERLARELHDSVGQVFGYLSLQAQTVQKRLRDGDAEQAEALLARLTDVAQHAHADVRESISALRTASSEDWSLLGALERCLEDFRTHYGTRTELHVAEGLTDESIPPETGVQLLRVVQEAMTNARRHGAARAIRVSLARVDGRAHVTVADDGCGFDPERLEADGVAHFGLGFMRERMEQIDGAVTIESRPGDGTRVRLEAPLSTTARRSAAATSHGGGDER